MFRLRINLSEIDFELADFHVGAQGAGVTNLEFDHFVAQIRLGQVNVEEEHFAEERMVRSLLDSRLLDLVDQTDATDRIDVTSVQLSCLENFHSDLEILSFRRKTFLLPVEDLIGVEVEQRRAVGRLSPCRMLIYSPIDPSSHRLDGKNALPSFALLLFIFGGLYSKVRYNFV